ncbi:MAG: YIP1 family protein [Gemmatimonadota bacterium]|nr:YIP1 family protein [Gemmatimonadota bacterium]
MSTTAPNIINELSTRPIVARAQAILLHPQSEWPVIDAEPATVASLYSGYIAPLAAIAPVASLIGMSVFGIRLPFGGAYRVPLGSAIVGAIVQYVLALGGTFVLALIIDALAPTFGGQRGKIQALKVAAYASTASWLAGVFALVPMLAILGVLGLYTLYLIYLGLPAVMHAPRERALGYAAAVIVSAIVLFMITGLIAARFVSYPSLSLPVR